MDFAVVLAELVAAGEDHAADFTSPWLWSLYGEGYRCYRHTAHMLCRDGYDILQPCACMTCLEIACFLMPLNRIVFFLPVMKSQLAAEASHTLQDPVIVEEPSRSHVYCKRFNVSRPCVKSGQAIVEAAHVGLIDRAIRCASVVTVEGFVAFFPIGQAYTTMKTCDFVCLPVGVVET